MSPKEEQKSLAILLNDRRIISKKTAEKIIASGVSYDLIVAMTEVRDGFINPLIADCDSFLTQMTR